MPIKRTFLALPLPKRLTAYLFTFPNPFKNQKDGINWVQRTNLHITLHFLGNTDSELIESHSEEFKNLIGSYLPIEFGLTDSGIYPHANNPRVLWIGAAPYGLALNELKKDIIELVKQLGYEVDFRKFQTHITLGRVKSLSRKSTFIHNFLAEEVNPVDFKIGKVKWYESILTPTGAIYEELKAFNFKMGGQ